MILIHLNVFYVENVSEFVLVCNALLRFLLLIEVTKPGLLFHLMWGLANQRAFHAETALQYVLLERYLPKKARTLVKLS